MKKIQVNTTTLKDNFLVPISKFDLDDKQCLMLCTGEKIVGLTYTSDRSTVLSVGIDAKGDAFDEPVVLKDVNRVKTVVEFISDPVIELGIDAGALTYKSPDDSLRFRCPFMESRFFNTSVRDRLSKVEEIEYTTKFNLSKDDIEQIRKSLFFAKEVESVYFYTENDKVRVSLHDPNKSLANTLSFVVANEYEGEEMPEMPIHISFFKTILDVPKGTKAFDMHFQMLDNTKHGERGAFVVTTHGEDWSYKYNVSTLLKKQKRK